MALSKRERVIAGVTGLLIGAFVLDQYAVKPYFENRAAAATELSKVTTDQIEATRTFTKQRRLEQDWRKMVSGGLKQDAGDAEQQLYEAVRDWAREAGVSVATSDPQRVARNDRTQIVRLRMTGTGTTAALSKLLWKVETSALPVKVEELSLTAQPQGTDNLSVTLTVSTIWVRPPSPDDNKLPRAPTAAPRRSTGGDDL